MTQGVGTRQLLITSRRTGAIVAELQWRSPGVAWATRSSPNMRSAVERWLRKGVQELIGERGRVMPRVTPQSSPEFLPRLRAYLERQFPLLQFELSGWNVNSIEASDVAQPTKRNRVAEEPRFRVHAAQLRERPKANVQAQTLQIDELSHDALRYMRGGP